MFISNETFCSLIHPNKVYPLAKGETMANKKRNTASKKVFPVWIVILVLVLLVAAAGIVIAQQQGNPAAVQLPDEISVAQAVQA